MSTLRQFSEKDKDYFAYQARQNYIRQQMSVYGELDATRQAKNEALLERDEAVSREQQALAERNALVAERDAVALREQQAMAEIEKLKALLADKK
jgi:anti-sigma factor RsiW